MSARVASIGGCLSTAINAGLVVLAIVLGRAPEPARRVDPLTPPITEECVVRIYDVRGIMNHVEPAPTLGWSGCFVGATPTVWDHESIWQVTNIIQDLVRSDGWYSLGGDEAGICCLPGRLVIRAPWSTHAEVERLLLELEWVLVSGAG